MKPVWLLILYALLFSGARAQAIQKENPFTVFISNSKGNCWLVTVRKDAVGELSSQPGIRVLRRLAENVFIVAAEKAALPASLVSSAVPANNNWKLSQRLLTGQQPDSTDFYIVSDSPAAIKKMLAQNGVPFTIKYEYGNTLQLKASLLAVHRYLLPDSRVSFIDIANRRAKEEVSISGFDYTINTVNQLHTLFPADKGANTVVSVKENRPDTADVDFTGRWLPTTAAASTLSSHASTMATIISGGGNSFYTANGVAGESTLTSSSFDVLLPDTDSFYRRYNISVQNHSYGTGIENFYGADAAAYDASVQNNPALLQVFSSGNSGNLASTAGAYASIDGFANLTGSFKMAKNIITVGSVDSFAAIPLLSSKGPAYDGRLKPELVAYGEDGSSGAAALVSGTALVLQGIYKKQHGGALPDAALVKAILLNSARDCGNKGIDFYAGFGNLDACRAATVLTAGQFFTGSVANGASQSFNLSIPANAKNLKILLAWTDPPALPNAYTALVNDLDLTVTNTANNQSWLPWVLHTFPHKDSLALLPIRARDSLNPAEQMAISDPAPGLYSIRVNGHRLAAGTQSFYIAYQYDSAQHFEWTYPTTNDNLLPGRRQLPRWNSNMTATGLLEYKYAGAANWQLLNNAVDLSGQCISWATPDSNAVAILRMTINGSSFLSDSFTVSAPLQTGVGYNCPGEALIYWNNIHANSYQVYQLGSRYMEPFRQTTDSAVLISKSTGGSSWFSIAPLLPFNKTGIHSIGFNYTTQGVDCYIKSFTADAQGSAGLLSLTLGTSYRVTGISLEKSDRNAVYQRLQAFSAPFPLQYTFTDALLAKGLNLYRARIDLSNGTTVYSDTEIISYLAGNAYLLYPNPVNRSQPITILSAQLTNPVWQLFNVYGQKIQEKKLSNLSEQIATTTIPKGIYFYMITEEGKKAATGKLVVQ